MKKQQQRSTLGIIKRSEKVTIDELRRKFPEKKQAITQELVDFLNDTMENPDFDSSTFLDTLVDFKHVMIECKSSMTEYINAIKFVGYLETGESLISAYKKARASDEFVQKRVNAPSGTKEYDAIAAAATRYRKNTLVRQLMLQSALPVHILFQSERLKAIGVLSTEMQSAAYSKDRIAAAKELLAATKGPDMKTVDLQIGPSQQAVDAQKELFAHLSKISEQQYKALTNGANITDVQAIGINVATSTEDEE